MRFLVLAALLYACWWAWWSDAVAFLLGQERHHWIVGFIAVIAVVKLYRALNPRSVRSEPDHGHHHCCCHHGDHHR